MAKKNKKRDKVGNSKGDPTFDMYHLFSRWDFILLVIFVLLTLAFTIAILLRDQVV